ncbi:ParB/RepB/Spo0J family partition protein [Sulfurivirga sp.]|uniref:ParB/RepB/Spo0J family partition protein n=1 Tax=Sulfurivirga sp. TaxID=2614236 RepID=UPI0025E644A6|nr:ParB/RepB/Spo0J family partition protein [Sulfurivirga sp.]
MARKKRGLGGRGLDRLLTGKEKAASLHTTAQRIETLPVDQLQPGRYQPRRQFDQLALDTLADSIRTQGVVQPIVVRPVETGYEIIAGERRWRAAQQAGLKEVPVIVRQADDQQTLALALIENLQREDLNPIEQAQGLARLIDEFALTHEQLAEAVGLSRSQVSNLLRLLNLPAEVQAWVHDGQLSMGHARALVALPEPLALALGRKAVEQGWSVRQMEQAARKAQETPESDQPDEKDPDLVALENRLAEKLGARVAIRTGKSGKGRVEIRFTSPDELDRLLQLLAIEL